MASLLIGRLLQAQPIGEPIELSEIYRTGDTVMSVRLLGALTLAGKSVDGLKVRDLSDVAWDEDEQLLYAVSDDGNLIHLRPSFTDGLLRNADLVAAHRLKDDAGNRLPDEAADAEGLEILNGRNGERGDTQLIVAFDGQARIVRYRADGTLIGAYPLPKQLHDAEVSKGGDIALQAIAAHPKLGLIIAPEEPTVSPDLFTLYGFNGGRWHFQPLDPEHSTLVGLEIGPGGSLLILERNYVNIFKPVVFAVRKLEVNPRQTSGGNASVKDIFVLSTAEDWALDNFEGLARHRADRYFMVSDDERNPFQRTLLVYFEVLIESDSNITH